MFILIGYFEDKIGQYVSENIVCSKDVSKLEKYRQDIKYSQRFPEKISRADWQAMSMEERMTCQDKQAQYIYSGKCYPLYINLQIVEVNEI